MELFVKIILSKSSNQIVISNHYNTLWGKWDNKDQQVGQLGEGNIKEKQRTTFKKQIPYLNGEIYK